MKDNIRELDESNFDEIIRGTKKLVVVQFYSTTCPVCKAMEPVFAEAAKEMGRDVIFTKVNVFASPSLASFYEVMGVPTFKFFCNTEMVKEFQGEINKTILNNTIKDLMKYAAKCESKSRVFELDGYG